MQQNKPEEANAALLMKHAALLLVADKPADARPIAQQALAQAFTAAEIKAANDMIARTYKAQDGTIGRANAFVAGIPTPSPSTPSRRPDLP